MKLKKLLLPLVMPLITFFVLMIIGTNIGVNKVDAQGTGLYNEPWTPAGDQQTSDAYSRAIHKDNCATPSLECLVHQIFQFTAIEWVNSIVPMHGAEPTTIPTTSSSGNTKNSTTIAGVGGAVNGLTYLMGQMYAHPVARTSTYVADVLQNAHIITPAYAQGLGFASLNPILNLWKAFRNIAYMLFVFIFVAIGFMIMFRQKIGGQSAVTAQQAIPNVITSLIFVTFSYAIAGFLIDLMYLTMFMIIGLFAQTTTNLDAGIIDFNIIEIATKLFVAADFNNNIDIIKNMTASLGSGAAAANVVGLIGGITLSLVIAIAVLIGTFKLFFELLKSYANVVLSVVTAPIVLLGGALPGKNAFTPWIKNIIGNLSAFPTVLLVIILFYQFTNNTTGATTTGGFLPPFLLGRGQSGAIASLMGLAIILALPEIVKDVKTKLGATEGFGTMIFNAATSRGKNAFNKLTTTPRKVLNTQPFSIGKSFPFKTKGTETALERVLIGSRANRKNEYDYQRQRVLHGLKEQKIKEGGMYGWIQDYKKEIKENKKQRGNDIRTKLNRRKQRGSKQDLYNRL